MAFCILVIVLAIIISGMNFFFIIVPLLTTIQDHLATTLILTALTIMTAPAILAILYSVLCIKKPSPERLKKATGYILIYPVMIVGGLGNALHPRYGFPIMLILATLAVYFFWVAICRSLIKYQGYIEEPIISYWTKCLNQILAFELFFSIGHIFHKQLSAAKDFSTIMMLSPVLFLLVPALFYVLLEKCRTRLYNKHQPSQPTQLEENA